MAYVSVNVDISEVARELQNNDEGIAEFLNELMDGIFPSKFERRFAGVKDYLSDDARTLLKFLAEPPEA